MKKPSILAVALVVAFVIQSAINIRQAQVIQAQRVVMRQLFHDYVSMAQMLRSCMNVQRASL